jgi:acetylglutamate kinase
MDDNGAVARHRGETVVIKYGGNAMVEDTLKRAFAEDVVTLLRAGVRPVVVHGGGPQISAALARQGIASEFRGGYRYTNTAAIDVVRQVLRDEVSQELAALIDEHEPVASVVPGDTAGLFRGRRRRVVVDGELVDLGFVGDIVAVDAASVVSLLDAGRIPVVSSVVPDADRPGLALNVNADAVAGALAVALHAAWLLVLTDVPGLYRDWPDRSSLVSRIGTLELEAMLPTLESGMVPKMAACLEAVSGGVAQAAVIDGREPHRLVREPFGASGTVIVPGSMSQQSKAEP